MRTNRDRKYGFMNRSLLIALGALIAAAALLAAVLLWRNFAGGKYDPLPVAAYSEAPRGFSGNLYELEARIESQLDYSEALGRLLAVRTLDGDAPLPLFVKPEITDFQPQTGQVYRLRVRVDEDGRLQLNGFRKL